MSNVGTKFIIANRFIFDPNTNSLVDKENDDQLVRLGSNESRILLMLSEKPNEVITRNELHDFVWREQGFEVDDSSLTQAISTLRKMLQDSTKSPQFVKTVPKRGYQLICPVEKTTPLMQGAEEEDVTVQEPIIEEPSFEALDANIELSTTEGNKNLDSKEENLSRWISRALIFISIVLPVSIILFCNPAETSFREIETIDGVVVKTPSNHPDLSSYLEPIAQCIKKYNEFHKDSLKPKEVIVTGRGHNQLALNYIHAFEYSYENVTLQLFSGSRDMPSVCQ
ncbi:winged helix-turn-helix domain-containing protein [Vibrio sonorensis]|uniref:winged helix-turn-helix domain-containing protein n=1 Tax=Vibrio sonorensis TaxID=1004316 RepID=UPI0008D9FA0E|nr:transcriptional regulator [Vibrio sonorensis]